MKRRLLSVYRRLYAEWGAQGWWPGEGRFEVMVGAILTQNTSWGNVEKAIANLKGARVLEARRIIVLDDVDLAALLRPSGYFNVKAVRLKAFCRWLLDAGGAEELARMPTGPLREALLGVKGVGPETADDILLYAFDRPVFVIDAYTRRLFSRLGIVAGDEPYEELRHRFEEAIGDDVSTLNEYHALIVTHGKEVCRPRPRCGSCPLATDCPSGLELADE